eukprot:854641_1
MPMPANSDAISKKQQYPVLYRKTGKHADEIVQRLLRRLQDPDEHVRRSVLHALTEIGKTQPVLVVTLASDFINHEKISFENKKDAIRLVAAVVTEKVADLPVDLGIFLVSFACCWLLGCESGSQTQHSCSGIIVSLSHVCPTPVLDSLLRMFPREGPPNGFAIQILADYAHTYRVKGWPQTIRFTAGMKEILFRFIPAMKFANQDADKLLYTEALGNFAEAVVSFTAEASDEDKDVASTEEFRELFESAFKIIFDSWRGSRTKNLRLAVFRTSGSLCRVISPNRFKVLLPSMIQVFLTAFKKEKPDSHLAITEGLCHIFEAMIIDPTCTQSFGNWTSTFTHILYTLQPLLALPLDYSVPDTVKNYHTLLRIHELFARGFRQETNLVVMNQLQDSNAQNRVSALKIVKHLVTHLGEEISRKKILLGNILPLCDDHNLQVKKALIRLVAAMADNGYLGLEGGQILMEFILQQCAITDRQIEDEQIKPVSSWESKAYEDCVTYEELRGAADYMLDVISTKVVDTEKLLWPFLFEFVCLPEFAFALMPVAKALSSLSDRITQDGRKLSVNWTKNERLPQPLWVLCALFLGLNTPSRRPLWAVEVVRCLGSLGAFLRPEFGQVFCSHQDELDAFLRGSVQRRPAFGSDWDCLGPADGQEDSSLSPQSVDSSQWQDALLKVFLEFTDVLTDQQCLRDLGNTLIVIFSRKGIRGVVKGAVLRYLGCVLQRSEQKVFVTGKINQMLKVANRDDPMERLACAHGIGIVCRSHFNIVIELLNAFLMEKTQASKKKSFFSFGGPSPKNIMEADSARMLVVESWGFCMKFAPPESIVPARIGTLMLSNFIPIVLHTQNAYLQEVCVPAIERLARALHPDRLVKRFDFVQRDDLIRRLLEFLRNESISACTSTINALTALAVLEPPLKKEHELRADVFAVCLRKTHDLHRIGMRSRFNTLDVPTDLRSLWEALSRLCLSLLHVDPCVETLVYLVQRLETRTSSSVASERLTATYTCLTVLKSFVGILVEGSSEKPSRKFPELGDLLAPLIPRIFSKSMRTRRSAVEATQALLYVSQLLDDSRIPVPSDEIQQLGVLKLETQAMEMHEQVAVVSSAIAKLIPTDFMPDFLTSLVRSSTDSVARCGTASGRALEDLVANRDHLDKYVAPLVDECLAFVATVGAQSGPDSDQCQAVSRSVVRLAETYFDDVLKQLFSHGSPLKPEVKSVFKELARAPSVNTRFFEFLLQTVKDTALIEGKLKPNVLVGILALTVIFPVEGIKAALAEYYAPIFATLIAHTGLTEKIEGIEWRAPLDALSAFFKATHPPHEATEFTKLGCFKAFCAHECDRGARIATEVICNLLPSQKRDIFSSIVPFLEDESPGCRFVCTAVVAEFIKHSSDDIAVLQQATRHLLPMEKDDNWRVRHQATRGLGDLGFTWSAELAPASEQVLAALSGVVHDSHETVSLEAIRSITQLIKKLDDEVIAALLPDIFTNALSIVNHTSSSSRESAFDLLGSLCPFGQLSRSFGDLVHSSMPLLIVHLNDEYDDVSKACLDFARAAIIHFDIPELSELFSDKRLIPPRYASFLEALCPILALNFPEYYDSYISVSADLLDNPEVFMRANAALSSALLLCSLPSEELTNERIAKCSQRLLKLLEDKSTVIRQNSAKSLAYLGKLGL